MHPRWARGWVPFPRLVYDPAETGGSPFWHERRVFSRHEAWEFLWTRAAHGAHPYAVPGTGVVLQLNVGETPPLSIRRLMDVWGWNSRRKVEDFIGYLIATKEIMKGQSTKFGDTYVFAGASPKDKTGDASGTPAGRQRDASGTMENEGKKVRTNTPPYGGSAEGDIQPAANPKVRIRRTPTLMAEDWMPNQGNLDRAAEWRLDLPRLLDDFRDYWIRKEVRRADWDSTFRNRMIACVDAGMFIVGSNGNGNGRQHVTSVTSVPEFGVAEAIAARIYG